MQSLWPILNNVLYVGCTLYNAIFVSPLFEQDIEIAYVLQ